MLTPAKLRRLLPIVPVQEADRSWMTGDQEVNSLLLGEKSWLSRWVLGIAKVAQARVQRCDLTFRSFHEKAGPCQECFALSMSSSLFSVQPSRLCRHPSIRTLL